MRMTLEELRTIRPDLAARYEQEIALTTQSTPTMAITGKRGARGGWREDLGCYFRSLWEANYTRYLNWLVAQGQITRWEYEPDTFEFTSIKRGTRFYTPDFKVFFMGVRGKKEFFEYHEVKGWMDSKSKTQLKRMAKYYPDATIKLIGPNEYQEIAIKMTKIISGWEIP